MFEQQRRGGWRELTPAAFLLPGSLPLILPQQNKATTQIRQESGCFHGFPWRKTQFSEITGDNREYPGISGPETPGYKYISEMFRLWRGLRLFCSIYNSACCLLTVCLPFAYSNNQK